MNYRAITNRADYITSLRQAADYLEAHPELPIPGSAQRIGIPLTTNAAVQQLATAQGWDVTADKEGNLRTGIQLGYIDYNAFGYVDFDQHTDRLAENGAREWADKHGMEIVPAHDMHEDDMAAERDHDTPADDDPDQD